MKKVTLTFEQLKKLVKEASINDGTIDELRDQKDILMDIYHTVGFAIDNLDSMVSRRANDLDIERWENDYQDELVKLVGLLEQVKKFSNLA